MFQAVLQELKGKNRHRSLSLPHGADFSSNDYLGMAKHPVLKAAAIEAFESGLDVGATASRLLRGHIKQHKDLEDFAAQYYKAGAALFFSNGFQANFGILSTLPSRKDIILYDEKVHASTRDGLQVTNAKSFKFAHNDLNALEDLLKRHREKADKIWVAVEALYSMDGDTPPLEEIYGLAQQYEAMMILDEAHSTGIMGPNGKGLSEGIIQKHGHKNLVVLHACGKAIGVAGGIVCAESEVIDYMINAARPFIYSTAPMPIQALLVQKSLEILGSQDGQERRTKILKVCKKAEELFGGFGTQIVPIMIGGDEKAIQTATAMQEAGYDIRAIRPPTVPEGTARLRMSLSSSLDEQVLLAFQSQLASVS